MIDVRGILLLVLDGTILGVLLLLPFDRSYDRSDTGSGSLVSLPPPLRPSYARCLVFLAVSTVVSLVLVASRTPDMAHAYDSLVTTLFLSVVHDHDSAAAYAGTLSPAFPYTVLSCLVAFSVAFRSSLARRLLIVANGVLYILISALIDAVVGLVLVEDHVTLGPAPLLRLLLQYAIAGIVVVRVGFSAFQLPRMTPLPLRRGHDWSDDLLLMLCVGAALTVTSFGAAVAATRLGGDQVVMTVIVLAIPAYSFVLTSAFLGLVRLITRRRVNPGPGRPPIEVIVPAFNEASVIERLLHSLDVAAGRYGGPVKVILCDDGSLDETAELAAGTMRRFHHAHGEIVAGAHTGKSGALNLGLGRCRADVVFRIDADCEVHPDCFVYSVPHFTEDPAVGLVCAMNLPKEPYTSWIDRMRLFEVITLYGFVRPASDLVDGIYCVPGTFTAFRRLPALEAGGFVEGMYGEDVEFTYSMGRLGYRAVMDTRILCFEDVPQSQKQLRIQRTRWNRGGIMAFGRHVPVVNGLSGPRFWFFATRQAVRRAAMPLKISLVTYLLALALLQPTSHHNLARISVVLLLRAAISTVPTVVLTLRHGKTRQLVWLPLQPVFHLLKLYYVLEAMLSFNPRPVALRAPAGAVRESVEASTA